MNPEIVERRVEANGLSFQTFSCGEGDRLALLLHGFPSHAWCWRDQLPRLSQLGFLAWAPSQRGYGLTDLSSRVADYAIDRLIEDIGAIIDASGARSTVLIAHDWGGLLAWFFAARRVRPLDALIILNAPHPACASEAFRHWRQIRKSWYIGAFQIPWLPDWLLGLKGAWLIGKLLQWTSAGQPVFAPEQIDFYRRQAARPGRITAMLNWYRALVRAGVPRELKTGFPSIETPTLVIWGEGDVALDVTCLEGLERFVSNLTVRRLPGISHWVQEQVPDHVNELIETFLLASKALTRAEPVIPAAPAIDSNVSGRTLAYYDDRAEEFRAGTWNHDVSQNIATLLRHIEAAPPFVILDFGCGPGRDLRALASMGHEAIGLDGAASFVAMARDASGCEVWQQDFLALALPAGRFDGVFANASLFHVPTALLPQVLRQLRAALKPRGVLFASNPIGENEEGWNGERYGAYHDLSGWRRLLTEAGFTELEHYYRPTGVPREEQRWLASAWRRTADLPAAAAP